MQIKHKFKRLAALALSLSMALLCMPVGAMPEDSTTPTDLAPDETVGNMVETDSAPNGDSDPEPAPTEDPRHLLAIAIAEHGAIYVPTVRQTGVFSDPRLNVDSLVYTTTGDIYLLLATRFTEHNTLMVWFLDVDGNVVSGYVSADHLGTDYLLPSDLPESNDLPGAEGMTDIGRVQLTEECLVDLQKVIDVRRLSAKLLFLHQKLLDVDTLDFLKLGNLVVLLKIVSEIPKHLDVPTNSARSHLP